MTSVMRTTATPKDGYEIHTTAHCGNVIYNDGECKILDKDGKDYDVYFNGDTFTVSALYYRNSESLESATQSADVWNDLSGKYEMDGSPINFNIQVLQLKPEDTPYNSTDRKATLQEQMMYRNQE